MAPARPTRTLALPEPIPPMLAVAGNPPSGPGWALEFKWDGVRAVATIAPGQARLTSRNNRDITRSYPELETVLAQVLAEPVILDGEIMALDQHGRPSFSRLQQRMHVQRPAESLLARVPVHYYVFDLLHLDGQPLVDQSYQWRREQLDGLDLDSRAPRLRVPANYLDVQPNQLLQVARDHGLEGILAKRLSSRYEPGRRSPAWVKTALLTTQEVVVCGWKPGEGHRASTLGSLLLGAYDDQHRLVFIGHVGTGFTEQTLRDLHSRLAPLQRPDSPFDTVVPREHARHAQWVEPVLVGEVVYRTLTPDGRLRHPAWRGLRTDKAPSDVKAPPQ